MDLKVKIGFDEKAEDILERLIHALGCSMKITPQTKSEGPAESISDVKMAEPVTEEKSKNEEEQADYAELKKEAKTLGVQLVQMKKKEEVKALIAKYGYKKISDVSDKDIVNFVHDLKEIREEKQG